MAPFVSPYGPWVGYVGDSNSVLKRVPLQGGTSDELHAASTGAVLGGTWTEDGSVLATPSLGGLVRIPVGGGEPQLLVESPGPGAPFAWPRLLPGGESVLTTLWQRGGGDRQIVVAHLPTREVKELIVGDAARYSPSGHLVYGVDGTLRAVRFDPDTLEVQGSSVEVAAGLVTKPQGTIDFDLSEEGDLVYVAGSGDLPRRLLTWVDRQGEEGALAAEARAYYIPRISPDGRRLVVTSRDDDQDLWVWSFERETLTRLTEGPKQDVYSVWVEGGREVVSSLPGELAEVARRGSSACPAMGAERLGRSPEDPLTCTPSPYRATAVC